MAPAVRPVTKYLCREKKTANGKTMEMNAAAVRSCQEVPKELTRLLIVKVMGASLGV
jgi:hypothetical protein